MLTPQEEAEMEKLPACIASDREWSRWMSRNNSVIADYFQGQFRNQLQCMTCSIVCLNSLRDLLGVEKYLSDFNDV